jgi:hypothetical protein
MSRARGGWASIVLIAAAAGAAAADSPVNVTDLLQALGATGIEVLYSSDLVPPGLESSAAQGSDALTRAINALAEHHLILRRVEPRRYIVSREPRAPISLTANVVPSKEAASSKQAPLEELTVFSSRYTFESVLAGEPFAFAQSDMQRVPGSQEDALRAIRASPGLATNLSSRPYIRGAFLDDVLVQYDGIPLVDPFHFKNFQSLISVFDPAAVGRVDVYTGGFPVAYGTRSAGVLDLTPRSVDSGYEYRVGANLLSYDFSTIGRSERWPIEWLATVRHGIHDIVLKPLNGDIGTPTYIDALGRIRWQANAAAAWTLGWILLDDRVQLSTDPAVEQADVRDRDVYAWLASDLNLSGALHSRSAISVTNSERRRNGTLNLPGLTNGLLAEGRDTSATDLRTDWSYAQSATTTWNFGAAVTLEKADLTFNRQQRFGESIALSFARPADASLASQQSLQSSTLGIFTDVHREWRAFTAEIGVRFDQQDYRRLRTHSQFSPRLNLRFDPSADWHVFGSWGQFVQAQRVGEWRSEENQLMPDPATHATHVITGVTYDSSSAIHWRLEAYRNHWTSIAPYFDNTLNPLMLLPPLGADRVRLAPTAAETAGVELSVRRSIGHEIEVSAAYSRSHTTDELNGRDVARSWDQPNAVNMDLSWVRSHFSASVLIGWHSGWPRTPVTVVQTTSLLPAYLVVGARNSARWGDYWTADLRVSQSVPIASGELALWIDATNITNKTNPCCANLGVESPSGTPILSTNAWLPRIFNGGFTWRFAAGR